jgi:hypothetical protein
MQSQHTKQEETYLLIKKRKEILEYGKGIRTELGFERKGGTDNVCTDEVRDSGVPEEEGDEDSSKK